MDFSSNFFSVLNGTSYRNPNRQERFKACSALEFEYSGEGPNIDVANIDEKIRAYINQTKIANYATYINFYKRVIDIENPTYVSSPTRYFMTPNGKEVKKTVLNRIKQLYEELDINMLMLEIDRKSMRVGTVVVTIQTDPTSNRLYPVVLSPDNATFNVKPNDRIPTLPQYLVYETTINRQQIIHNWTPTQYIAKLAGQPPSNEIIAQEEHGFDGVPFAILRSVSDSTRFWGPFDATSWRVAQTRSILLADTVHRTQTSLYEYLLFIGFKPDEAIAAVNVLMSGKVFNAPPSTGPDGHPIKKDVKFISPKGIEPQVLWETWMNLYRFYLSTRDLNPRIYEFGKQVASGDAMIQSDVYMRLKRSSRKNCLAKFERDLFKIIIWQNNQNSNNIQIPEDLKLEIDWQPDKIEFVNLKDKTKYYKAALARHELTVPKIIRAESGEDISIETAMRIHQKNREYNMQFDDDIENAEISDQDIEDAEAEVEGTKKLGNPLQKGRDSKGYYVRWGDSGKKYYYNPDSKQSFEDAKAKALKQGRAIKRLQNK